ncbi:MAG TPA: hypothetical protein VMB80_17000 [Candidatus Acidoferrum sp.]|nr:hypothetical protein [Candidatus Acidoferrum sp.]
MKSDSAAMLVPGVPAAARVLQLAQQAAERVNLMLIGELLPLGVFDQFQNFFHALQGLFQGFDDSHHLVDGLADGRTLRVARHWTGRFLPGRNGFTGRGTGGRFGRAGRSTPARAAPATTAPSPPASAAQWPGGGGWMRSGGQF